MATIDCSHMKRLLPGTRGRSFVGKCLACGAEVRSFGMALDVLSRCSDCGTTVWCCDFCRHKIAEGPAFRCNCGSACNYSHPNFEALRVLANAIETPPLEEN